MNTSQAKSREYGTDAIKGWAALHTNAPVNLINGLIEPLRGDVILFFETQNSR